MPLYRGDANQAERNIQEDYGSSVRMYTHMGSGGPFPFRPFPLTSAAYYLSLMNLSVYSFVYIIYSLSILTNKRNTFSLACCRRVCVLVGNGFLLPCWGEVGRGALLVVVLGFFTRSDVHPPLRVRKWQKTSSALLGGLTLGVFVSPVSSVNLSFQHAG